MTTLGISSKSEALVPGRARLAVARPCIPDTRTCGPRHRVAVPRCPPSTLSHGLAAPGVNSGSLPGALVPPCAPRALEKPAVLSPALSRVALQHRQISGRVVWRILTFLRQSGR
ncbi:hypothetical protein OH77DRAFT_120473 [Trametes cingulata]|nr:hypothetical protein OH77DRAFT_120473 [Trametes cingulata]